MTLPSTVLHSVDVNVAPSYPIWIGMDLIGHPSSFSTLPNATSAIIITNTTVAPLYLEKTRTSLRANFQQVFDIILPDGEQYKNWEILQSIFTFLLKNTIDRKCMLFALGGGVIGDTVGFAAACYQRGVAFVQIPTTLLAQVDSSVGGKTGINHPLGKNMIGAFYQPLRVLCDIDTLATLPEREFNSGLAEIIKYGPIADMTFFDWIENHIHELLSRDTIALAYAIKRSCEIKAWVVKEDEKEANLRAILNFGHTFGHAIEAGLGYGQWLHGEAIGCGMIIATKLSRALNLVDDRTANRIIRLIEKAKLPTRAPILNAENNVQRYIDLIKVDKKNIGGVLRFTVINPPNIARIESVPLALVAQTITECCATK